MAAASMDEAVHEEDKKGSPREQEPQRPASADKKSPSPKPKMQGLPPYQQEQSQQYYSASNHTSEYRASPNGATPTLLPPIQHHFDGQTMQSQAQYVPAAHLNGAPHMMHAQQYAPSIVSYQTQPMPPTMPSNAPSGQNGMMRFPIPPQGAIDARNMTGGRHKKEIKRRTKTGCLTCRKRRIKCDEAQPSCRNCAKSKRECLGYDPIFKQQAGPTNIKPAPSPTTLSAHLSTTPPISSNSYQAYPGTTGTFVPRGPEPLYPYHNHLDSAPTGRESSSPDMAQAQSSPGIKLQPIRRVRVVAMDELYSLNDIPPPFEIHNTSTTMSDADHKNLADFYGFHYAPGLDRLFETTWYRSRGFAYLTADPALQDLALQSMAHMRASDGRPNQEGAIASLEARLVWQLALMPRSKPAIVSNGIENDTVTQEVLPRIAIMENLLTGDYLESHLVPPPPTTLADRASEELKLKYNQQVFWHNLGKFTSLRDDQGSGETTDQISRALSAMRAILSMLENRDVLYSIAIARHIGGRLPDWSPQRHALQTNADHNDEANKLHVAYNFVEQEHQRGTTQVIQRICSMSLRSWMLQKQQ